MKWLRFLRPSKGAAPETRAPKDRGAALIMVLWGAVVMSIIAAAAARQATTTAVVVNAGAELTRARALADGGVRAGWTAFADGRISELGRSWTCRSGEDVLFVRIRPETSRIDINTATEEMLAALYEVAGADAIAAQKLAAATVDYRSHGEQIEEEIAAPLDEMAPTPAAGLPTPGPFETIEELGYVPGMTAGIFRAIAGDITVHSRALDVDRRFASSLVTRALDRAVLRDGSEVAVEADAGGPPAFEGSLMNVRAVAVTASGAVYVRQAVVEGPLDSSGPPVIMRLVQGRLDDGETLPDLPGAIPCLQGFTAIR